MVLDVTLPRAPAGWRLNNTRIAMNIGVVIIGRNEGERLRRCLTSVRGIDAVVYVDSGSTDGSVELAHARGVETVALDMSIPFTAARARNAGLACLLRLYPDTELVQFIDGDCEIMTRWLARASRALDDHPKTAAVWGRLRERYPEASIYNRISELEWDTPVGEADGCGGIVMMRVDALREVGGFRAGLIAGEEPELCARLRGAGWKIRRIDGDMVWHDAAMTRFGQWWKRSVRTGHAFAEVANLHRDGPVPLWVRECRSNWFWGLLLPAFVLIAAPFTAGLSLLLLLLYVALGIRIFLRWQRAGRSEVDAAWYALLCVLGKFAHALGQMRYLTNRFLSRPSTLIEYKTSSSAPREHAA
jgi:GT2 family glycosyltransferase